MLIAKDIHIRDPFILTDTASGYYYLYGTTAYVPDEAGLLDYFLAYKSRDLENFEGPFEVFDGHKIGFWADRNYWAPEVHIYKGKYYMFASFKSPTRHRGTQILVADNPLGPFKPITDYPQTPSDWEALDGTLYIQDGVPYLVFSHEWVQIYNGDFSAVQLSDDLTHPVGEPFVLFKATDNPDILSSCERDGNPCYITDGPFFVNDTDGVHMLWSGYGKTGYSVYDAYADKLEGPYIHTESRYDFDGGHCMVFTTFEGKKMITLHAPNAHGLERPVFLPY